MLDYLGVGIAALTALIGIFWEPRKNGPLKVGVIGGALFLLLVISIGIDVIGTVKNEQEEARSKELQDKVVEFQKLQLNDQKTLLESQEVLLDKQLDKLDVAEDNMIRLLDQNDDIKHESAQMSAKMSVLIDGEDKRFDYLVSILAGSGRQLTEEKLYLVKMHLDQLDLVEACDVDGVGDIYYSIFADGELLDRVGPSGAKQVSTDIPYKFKKNGSSVVWSKLTKSSFDSFRVSGYVRERDDKHWFTKKWLFRTVGEFNRKITAKFGDKEKVEIIPLDGGVGCKAKLTVRYSMSECDSGNSECNI